MTCSDKQEELMQRKDRKKVESGLTDNNLIRKKEEDKLEVEGKRDRITESFFPLKIIIERQMEDITKRREIPTKRLHTQKKLLSTYSYLPQPCNPE